MHDSTFAESWKKPIDLLNGGNNALLHKQVESYFYSFNSKSLCSQQYKNVKYFLSLGGA